MTAHDDLVEVVRLACLTADRSDVEQRALLRVAERLDRAANRDTTTNQRSGPASRLYREAEATRELVDDQRPQAKQATLDKLDAGAARWEAARCT